jgi:long-subunit fatty acid transport protein
MMFYTAPSYTLALNDRWSLHGGLIASNYQGMNYTSAGENLFPGNVSSLSVFVAGSYRMSDRLVLHGAGVKQLISAPITHFTPYPMDDLSLGATYRIGDNLTVGASVHMRNVNGYSSSPFGTPIGIPFGTPYFPSSPGW